MEAILILGMYSVERYNNGGINLKGDDLELIVISPPEGIDEFKAKDLWSRLKNNISLG